MGESGGRGRNIGVSVDRRKNHLCIDRFRQRGEKTKRAVFETMSLAARVRGRAKVWFTGQDPDNEAKGSEV